MLMSALTPTVHVKQRAIISRAMVALEFFVRSTLVYQNQISYAHYGHRKPNTVSSRPASRIASWRLDPCYAYDKYNGSNTDASATLEPSTALCVSNLYHAALPQRSTNSHRIWVRSAKLFWDVGDNRGAVRPSKCQTNTSCIGFSSQFRKPRQFHFRQNRLSLFPSEPVLG